MSGRNDIIASDGRKISGNAQFSTKGRMFSHGTLLFDSEIDSVVAALKVRKDKIESKGIKSIRSRVANISEYLNEQITIEQFRELYCAIYLTELIQYQPMISMKKTGKRLTKYQKSVIKTGIGITENHRNLTTSTHTDFQSDKLIYALKFKRAS